MNRQATNAAKPEPPPDLDDIEVPLLVAAIYRRWGYDFRDYAADSPK